jgi:hypothetical protein
MPIANALRGPVLYLNFLFSAFQVHPHFAARYPSHDLGQGQPAPLAPFATSTKQWPQELAFRGKPLLIVLCLEPPAESPLQVRLLAALCLVVVLCTPGRAVRSAQ